MDQSRSFQENERVKRERKSCRMIRRWVSQNEVTIGFSATAVSYSAVNEGHDNSGGRMRVVATEIVCNAGEKSN